MHVDEVEIDAALVRRLLLGQFPRWAELPIAAVSSAGTDNAIYRLGEDLAVRLPRRREAAGQIDKEHRWLPRLAPQLPLAIPIPVELGEPAVGYPYPWSVCRWLEGEDAVVEPITDLFGAAVDLARFVVALHAIDSSDGPSPGTHNSQRGVPLAQRDAQVRAAIASLHGILDTDAATGAWEAALRAPVWDSPPVWLHGDLHPGNLLVRHGRLSAVIDFGCLGVGDPACDLMVAWTLLTGEAREKFRGGLAVDDAAWARGRGWALSFALIALPYYLETNPVLVGIARRTIDEVLADQE